MVILIKHRVRGQSTDDEQDAGGADAGDADFAVTKLKMLDFLLAEAGRFSRDWVASKSAAEAAPRETSPGGTLEYTVHHPKTLNPKP
jgi:hypothetical protein